MGRRPPSRPATPTAHNGPGEGVPPFDLT